jgi:hypothetical protein
MRARPFRGGLFALVGYRRGVTIVIGIALFVAMLAALGVAIVVGIAIWMVAMSRDGLKFCQAIKLLLSRSEKPSAS